jgi:Skp family chaperone for outer membrane proteins
MSNPLHYAVAQLAAEYDTARDEITRLEKTGAHTPRRMQAFARALAAAEHIVLLSDSTEWRTKARAMRQESERARDNAQKHLNEVERDAKSLATLNDVSARQFHGEQPLPEAV